MIYIPEFGETDWVYSPYAWVPTVLATILYFASLPQANIYSKFPRVGGTIFRWTPVHEVVADGYRKITKPMRKPVVVRWWARDYIILPAKYLADLRAADWGHLHFFKNISDALFLYSTVDDMYTSPVSQRMVEVVKKRLNPKLPQITPILLDEIEYGFHKEISAGNSKLESREVNAMKFFSGIVHRSATRVMIGSELCRDEDFLKETTNLLDSIFFTATMIVNLPLGPFRPAFVWLLTLPHKWKLARCAKKLQPVLLERIKKRRSERVGQEQLVGDAIDWTLDLIKDDPKYDTPERLAHELLHNLWAASSAPGGMMTEIVYQLLTYPEYIEPLRSEAEKAVKEGGWTEKMLANLHLQDSFIREVNRLLPTGAITCSRTVEGRPFEFSDGLKLPVGTRFGFPIQAMQHDAEHFESPLEFDAFRFVRKAQAEGSVTEDVHRWSATAMSTTNLAWGYGNHICPGRFFAIRMLKFIFTKLLLEYDVTWNREEGAARPQCINVEGQFVPNLSQKVVLGPRTQI